MRIVLVPNLPITSHEGRAFIQPEMPLGLLALLPLIPEPHVATLIDPHALLRAMEGFGPAMIEMFADAALANAPDVVGFTTRCDSYTKTLLVAAAVKARSPGTKIVLGGPQATQTDKETLTHFPFVDFIVRNEAEYSFPALLACLVRDGDPASVAGLTYRSRGGEVLRSPDLATLTDVELAPFPRYEALPWGKERGILELEVGRGCPFTCTFCSTNTFFSRSYRLKSPRRIAADIGRLVELYGPGRPIVFVHDLFTVDQKRVRAICEYLIAHGPHVYWGCQARIDCVSEDLLTLMKKAGCVGIYFGVETGSEVMQRLISKKMDLKKVRPIVAHGLSLGLDVFTSLIYGFPQETPETLSATLQLAAQLSDMGAHVSLKRFAPIPGTPIMKEVGDRLRPTHHFSAFCGIDVSLLPGEEKLVEDFPDIFSGHYTVVNEALPEDSIAFVDLYFDVIQSYKESSRLLRATVEGYDPLRVLEELMRGRQFGATSYRDRVLFLSRCFFEYCPRSTG